MWPYNCCFVGCCFPDLFKAPRSILVKLQSSFSSMRFTSVYMVHRYSSMDTATSWKKSRFILSDRSDFHLTHSSSHCLVYADIIFGKGDVAVEVCELVY